MSETKFYKPQPREPWRDWRMYSMLLPILSGAFGACIFMALGFSFTEMEVIPSAVRTRMVVLAAFGVAFGSTFGSIGSGIEIFRKRYKKETEPWDWISLAVSTLTTIAGFAMGFAALLGAAENWSAIAQAYGSLVVGTLAGLDSLGDMIELGGLFGSYEMRTEAWLEDQRAWQQSRGVVTFRAEPETDELVFDPSWPKMGKTEFVDHLNRLNGDRATLADPEVLEKFIHSESRNLPSRSTLKRFREMAREGR
jgi:hypothetical protein